MSQIATRLRNPCPAFQSVHDPAWLFKARGHREALAVLDQAVAARRPATILTGAPGAGKTLLLRALAAAWEGRARIAWINGPDRAGDPLGGDRPANSVQALLDVLPLGAPPGSAAQPMAELQRQLQSLAGRGAAPALLFVDDAHLLTDAALDRLSEIADLASEGTALMPVILAGDPTLAERLALPRNTALASRIGDSVALPPIEMAETAAYVENRFEVARCPCHHGDSPFDPGSLKVLHHWSGGVPGVLNEMAMRCLRDPDLGRRRSIGATPVEMLLRSGSAGARPMAAPPPSAMLPPAAFAATTAPHANAGQAPNADVPLWGSVPAPEARALPVPYVQADPPPRPPRRGRSALVGLALLAVIGAGVQFLIRPMQQGATLVPDSATTSRPAALHRNEPVPGQSLASARLFEPQAEAERAALASAEDDDAPRPGPISAVPDPAALLDEALAIGRFRPALAALLYQRAALWGNARAAYYLGQAYETGTGFPADMNRARAWYGAATGVWGAAQRLEALEAAPPVVTAAPVPTMQASYVDGRTALHWRAAEGDSPDGFIVEYQPAGVGGEVLRLVTSLSAVLIAGPVARWRVIAGTEGGDAPASRWIESAPPAR